MSWSSQTIALDTVEHLDLAWRVGLDPYGRLGLADVAQEWSEDDGGHRG
jgi:hypothetical protein